MAKRTNPKTHALTAKTLTTETWQDAVSLTLVWWPKVTLCQYDLQTQQFTGRTLPLEPTLTDSLVRQASFAASSRHAPPTSPVASPVKPATHKRRATAPATTRKRTRR